MASLKSSQIAPEWSCFVTADLALGQAEKIVPEPVAAELKRFTHQGLNLVWKRLSKNTREWLTEWWQS